MILQENDARPMFAARLRAAACLFDGYSHRGIPDMIREIGKDVGILLAPVNRLIVNYAESLVEPDVPKT